MEMDNDMDMDMDTDKIIIKRTVVELSVTAHQHEPNIDQGSSRQKICLHIYIFEMFIFKYWKNNEDFTSLCFTSNNC